jgi:hypothetical protein
MILANNSGKYKLNSSKVADGTCNNTLGVIFK